MLKRKNHPPSVFTCQRSIAAMEFALVAPLMLVLLGGVYDTSEALILYTEVYNCAHTIPASASSYAVRSNGATILSYDEIQLMESEVWADLPELRSGGKISSSTSVTLTAVTFSVDTTQAVCKSQARNSSPFLITSGCQYIADQLWSVAYQPSTTAAAYTGPSTFNNELRACAAAQQVAPTGSNPPNPLTTYLDTLPVANLSVSGSQLPSPYYTPNYTLEAGPTPILVTDVQFTYKPGFSFIFHGNVTFWVLGLWPVRNVASTLPLVFYQPNSTWVTAANYPSGIVTGQSYFVSEPLQQQFTQLYGIEVQAGTAQAIVALMDPLNEAGTVNNAYGGSTADGPSATPWCVYPWAANPQVISTAFSGVSF